MSFMKKLRSGIFAAFKQCLFVFFIACQSSVSGQTASTISIIPVPVSMQVNSGSFALTSGTTIGIPAKPAEVSAIAAYFADKVKPATGFNLRIATTGGSAIQFVIKSPQDTKLGKEGYTL